MSKIVLCDVDGVVADMIPEWLYFYNMDYDDCLTVDNIVGWSVHNFVKNACGKKIYDYLAYENLYDDVQPFPGALEGIKELREAGFRVVFVTSGVQPAKIKWLQRHGFIEDWMSSKDVIIAHDKSLVRGDYLIDDGLHNCEAFDGVAILFDQPWNRHSDEFFRVSNWDFVTEYLLLEACRV